MAETAFKKRMDFQLWRARDLHLDLGSGPTAYRRASLIDLYLHTIFHWNQTNLCGRTDIRTYKRMDGHLRPALLGRLCRRVDLTKKSQKLSETEGFQQYPWIKGCPWKVVEVRAPELSCKLKVYMYENFGSKQD